MRAIKRSSMYPSILRIRKFFKYPSKFSFVPVDKDITKEINHLDPKKTVPQDDVPVKLLKLNNDIFSRYLSHIFNECIETSDFPN